MNNTLVSIIIPVYNVAQYVEQCLESVLNQTYDNIEVIVVDDCGTDDSMAIVERIKDEYQGEKTIKILHHDHNRGLSAARNTGISDAKGEWLYFLDSDDKLTKNCISLMLESLSNYPNVQLIQGRTKAIPENSYYDTTHLRNIDYVDNNLWIRKNFFKQHPKLPVLAWNKLVNKDFLISNNLYFDEGLIHEDEMWMFKVVHKIQYMSFVHDVTYLHYETENSIMSTFNKKGNIDSWLKILLYVTENIDVPCKREQIVTYLGYFLYRYDELSAKTNQLTNNFCKLLLSIREYSSYFALKRLSGTKKTDILYYYKNNLEKFVQCGSYQNPLDIIRFEIDMIRVRFSPSKLLR